MFKFATRRGFSKFFGTRTPHDSTDSVAKVSGLPSPSCGGSQGILWCEMAPQGGPGALIASEHTEPYPRPDHILDDDFEGMKKPHTVNKATKRIYELVYNQEREGKFVLILGGDHLFGISTVSGVAKAMRERHSCREIGEVWIDAHADIDILETSSSGMFDWIKERNLINLQKFVYIGLRDVGDPEKDIIARHGVEAFYTDDVREHGIQKVMDSALEYVGDETPLHVSFDIDSLNPEWAPSTVFPVAPRLTRDEGVYIAQRLSDAGILNC